MEKCAVFCKILIFGYCAAGGYAVPLQSETSIGKSTRMTLRELEVGESAVVMTVGGEGSLRQHFLDMGILPGAEVKLMKYAPMGDPMELLVQGYVLTLRLAEAEKITVKVKNKDCRTSDSQAADVCLGKGPKEKVLSASSSFHPGLGEAGKYHDHDTERPLPKGTTLTLALAGQQNSGKTTLFNQLTGSNQHVGNFPGVTVDRKDGQIKASFFRGRSDEFDVATANVIDLPGIYSLSAYTAEELVSRDFILKEKPQGLINIVDASNIERHLYLTIQLMELGVPMVLALNMMDEVTGNGGSVRLNDMERILGIPVVAISAAKGEGIDELVEHAVHVSYYQEAPARQDFCSKDDHGGAVHRCLHSIMHLIEDHAERVGLPLRFAAGKLIEGDEAVAQALQLTQNEQEMVEHIVLQMEEERGLDRAAAMADMRFTFIHRLCEATVVKPRESIEYSFTVTGNRTLVAKFTLDQHPTGAINGLFTINANGDQVFFSQGNLQYKASTGTWRFAENHWDFVGGMTSSGQHYGNVGSGNSNNNISQTYNGWIDLFSWGTSGWPTGANRLYQPWQTGSASLFGPPGENDLTGSYANSDWGVYNAISNGGNTTNTWRTLTGGSDGEWKYIFESRSTASGIRYAKAQVNGVNGVILLPDDWNESFYPLYNTNMANASWSSNNISVSQWPTLEQYGAVFLPAAGYRDGTIFDVGNNGINGYYWSASCCSSDCAKSTVFYRFSFEYSSCPWRNRGYSVRLVQDY